MTYKPTETLNGVGVTSVAPNTLPVQVIEKERLWRPSSPTIEHVFSGDFTTDIFDSPSGATLIADASEREVYVADNDPRNRFSTKDPMYQLHAKLEERASDDDPWAFRFTVRTRNPYGDPDRRHPDLPARWFVARSLRYFAEVHDRPVGVIQAEWHNELRIGDNFTQYAEALGDRPGSEITQEDMDQAALATWTGRTAVALGYDNPHVRVGRYLSAGIVRTDFSKNK